MCGIIGFAGKTVKKFNKSKLDILGIYNEVRGTDSCGVTTDGQIYIGIDKQKVFKDFLILGNYDIPKLYPTVLGHTRNSSRGLVNEHNAHPFGFGQKEDGTFNFIGVHNGTLQNADELADKFNITKTATLINGGNRVKIDSEILLECIYQNKNFKVLNEYIGTATLVFTDTTKPNTIYCYHGASKKEKDDADDKIYEERPLFYWKETKNSLYVSSIEESLIAIGGTEKTVGKFDYNTVYEITDGDITLAKLTRINRKKCYQNKNYSNYSNYSKPNKQIDPIVYDAYSDYEDVYDTRFPFENKQINLPAGKTKSKVSVANNGFNNIYNDITNNIDGKIRVKSLRYVRNGHEVNGIYTYIPKYGFYLLGQDLKNAEQTFHYLTGKEFLAGDFVKVDQPCDLYEKFIPFPLEEINKMGSIESFLYFIYDGIRVKTLQDYNICIERKLNKKPFDYTQLSNCSCHPIIDTTINVKGDDKQGILSNGVLYTGSYTMLGSDKIYDILNGNCIKITSIPEVKMRNMSKILEDKGKVTEAEEIEFKDVINEVETLAEVSKLLADNEIMETSPAVNDLLDKDLNEMFLPSYKNFPSYIKRLNTYKSVPEAKKAIKLLEAFLNGANELIAIEYND